MVRMFRDQGRYVNGGSVGEGNQFVLGIVSKVPSIEATPRFVLEVRSNDLGNLTAVHFAKGERSYRWPEVHHPAALTGETSQSLQFLSERLPLQEFHDKKIKSALLANVIERADVGE